MSRSSTSSSDVLSDRDTGCTADGLIAPAAPARVRSLFVSVAFIAVCGGTGLVDLLAPVEIRVLGAEAREEERLRAEASFWDGSLARWTERELSKTSRVRRALGGPWRAARWGVFRDPGPGLAVDEDGYLFREALNWHTVPTTHESRLMVRRCVGFVSRRLGALNARVMVVAVPPKILHRDAAFVAPRKDRRRLRRLRELLWRSSQQWIRDVGEDGVPVISLGRTLAGMEDRTGKQTFARTDTHWTFEGARQAAEFVALRVDDLALPGFLVRDEALRTTRIVERGRMRDAGNLYDVMGISSTSVRNGEAEATVLHALGALHWIPRLEVVDRESGELVSGQAPMDAPVVLVGTSFSGAANFIPMLQHYSNHRVRGVAKPGGGVGGALEDVIRSAIEHQRGALPKCVLWEFPLHFVRQTPGSFARLVGLATWLPMYAPSAVPGVGTLTGKLRPGVHELGGRFVSAHARLDGLTHPGDGRVGIRLEGTVDRPVEVHVSAPNRRTFSATWLPIRGVLTLPLIWPEVASATIAVRAPAGARLDLKSVGVVWDLDVPNRTPVELAAAAGAAPDEWAFSGELPGFSDGRSLVLQTSAAERSFAVELIHGGSPGWRKHWTIDPGARTAVLGLPHIVWQDAEVHITGGGKPPSGLELTLVPQKKLP